MIFENDIENPFDVTRTEYFNSRYALIAEYFEEPSFYNDLMERERFIIVGSRGTGKTMILKSLYLAVFINSLKIKGVDPSAFIWKFIGVYVPCDNLDLQKYLSESYVKYMNQDSEKAYIIWRRYLCNYLAIYIVKQILSTLIDYGQAIGLNFSTQEEVNQKILQRFDNMSSIKDDWPRNFTELPNFLDREQKIFLDFVMDRIQGSDREFNRPIMDLSFIKDVSNILIKHFEKIKNCRFYILLDDFFPPFVTFKQQAVLLDLIRERGGPLSFKITTIPEGITYTTDSGYEMRPDLDYSQKFLEFQGVGRNSEYWELVKEVTNKRLEKHGCNYLDLFEEPDQNSNDFLKRLRGEVSKGHDRPIYAGFDMIVEMSSGVIGTYLLLVREMIHLIQKEKGCHVFSKETLPIPCEVQDSVVRNRSDLFLGAILGLEQGQSLYRLVTLMARESRERFLKNPVAKEYIQFKIKNYEELLTEDREAHRKLIIAFRNNILHSPDCYPTDRQQNVILRTLIINRLLTPALKIPYRDRWAVDKEASDIIRILMSDTAEPQPITEAPPLSPCPQPVQQLITEEKVGLPPIIRKSACSIFLGNYCTKSSELLVGEHGVFLALPFKEDWHKITQQLIKKKIPNVITSLDVSPNGDFTCKICECICRREYGIYEISVLNDNVIFEMGLSLGMGKPTFAIWNDEWWSKSWGETGSPITFLIDGFEGFPYYVAESNGITKLANEIKKSLTGEPWNRKEIKDFQNKGSIFLCLPIKSVYYDNYLKEEALKAIDEIGIDRNKVVKLPKDFKEGLTFVNAFREILQSNLCIIDSTQMPYYRTDNEQLADYIWRMFCLGVAAGLRKPLIHCFNSNYTQFVASDIRGKCTFVYKDAELHDKLQNALKESMVNEKGK